MKCRHDQIEETFFIMYHVTFCLESYDRHKNMTSITKISTFILIICVLFVNGDTGGDAVNSPSFTVNLDLPEEKRWSNIVLKYKELVPDFEYIMKYF